MRFSGAKSGRGEEGVQEEWVPSCDKDNNVQALSLFKSHSFLEEAMRGGVSPLKGVWKVFTAELSIHTSVSVSVCVAGGRLQHKDGAV